MAYLIKETYLDINKVIYIIILIAPVMLEESQTFFDIQGSIHLLRIKDMGSTNHHTKCIQAFQH